MKDRKLIRSCIEHACSMNGLPRMAREIKYEFSSKMTNAFGLAYLEKNLIRISSPLWDRATEIQKKTLVVHEACHIVAWYKHQATGHDKGWQTCMIRAGYPPDICHDVHVGDLKKEYVKYEAACECRKVTISHVRAGKIRNKRGSYSCRKCNAKLRLTGKKVYPSKSA